MWIHKKPKYRNFVVQLEKLQVAKKEKDPYQRILDGGIHGAYRI